jgi:hypothetical protein
METGNLKGTEDTELKAMRIREAVGLESELPQSHLATLYLREHEAERLRLLAARAFDAFSKESSLLLKTRSALCWFCPALCASCIDTLKPSLICGPDYSYRTNLTVPNSCQPDSTHFCWAMRTGRVATR